MREDTTLDEFFAWAKEIKKVSDKIAEPAALVGVQLAAEKLAELMLKNLSHKREKKDG